MLFRPSGKQFFVPTAGAPVPPVDSIVTLQYLTTNPDLSVNNDVSQNCEFAFVNKDDTWLSLLKRTVLPYTLTRGPKSRQPQ